MTHPILPDAALAAAPAGASSAPPQPDPAVMRLRAVHRAASELRRGTPVLLLGGESLVLVPAETVGARGLDEFAALADGEPLLLLAPSRAAAILRRPVGPGPLVVALQAGPRLLDPLVLGGIADPTAAQLLPEEPALAASCPVDAPAALALVKLARLLPAVLAVRAGADAVAAAARLNLLSVPAEDVLAYPPANAAGLKRVAEAQVPLDGAPDARVIAFRAPDSAVEHLAIVIGRPDQAEAPLVRLHSECFTGDLLGSLRCDCGAQLRGAIRRMADEGAGALLYLAQEGRGIGLVNKLRAYALQDRGLDTVDANRALGWGADERNFMVAATMLEQLGLGAVRLLTNNPDKVTALEACGVRVIRREQHAFAPNGINDQYLATKAARFGHLLG